MFDELIEQYLKTEEDIYSKYMSFLYICLSSYFLYSIINFILLDNILLGKRISSFLDFLSTLSSIAMILCTIALLLLSIIIIIKSKVISIVLKMIVGLFISLIIFSVLHLIIKEFAIILTLAIVIYNNRRRIALLKKYKRYFKYIALICIVTVFSNILSFLIDTILNKPAILLMILDKLHIYDIENIVHILVFIVTFSPFISLTTFVLSMQYILNKEIKKNNVPFLEVIKIMNVLPIILILLIFSFISLLHSSIDDKLTDLFNSPLDTDNVNVTNFEFDNNSVTNSVENYVDTTTTPNNGNIANASFVGKTVENYVDTTTTPNNGNIANASFVGKTVENYVDTTTTPNNGNIANASFVGKTVENYVDTTTTPNNSNIANASFVGKTVEHNIISNNFNNNVDFNTPEKNTSEEIYQINIPKENITDKIIINNNDKGIIYDMNGNEINNIEILDDKTTIIKDNMGNVIQKNDGHFIYDNEGKATAIIDNNSIDTIIDPQTKDTLLNDDGTIYDGKTGELKATIEKK